MYEMFVFSVVIGAIVCAIKPYPGNLIDYVYNVVPFPSAPIVSGLTAASTLCLFRRGFDTVNPSTRVA